MLFILLVIFMFSLLVFVHELGHFLLAKRNGVGVEEFGFGFPPRVFGKKVGETIYSINLLPLGGFVRLTGEDAADRSPRSFGGASTWAKSKILLAGVVMNLLTAFVLFLGLALTGLPPLGPLEPKFLSSSFSQPPQLLVARVEPNSPAAKAGLKRGDYLLSVNGQQLKTDEQLRETTRQNAGKPVELVLKRGDEQKTVSNVQLRQPSEQGILGVVSQSVYKLKYDPLQAIAAAGYLTLSLFWLTITAIVSLILQLPALVLGLFSPGVPQAAEGASGPLGIFQIMRSLEGFDPAYFVLLLANLSIALAGFNVLPLPALDGGRLAAILARKLPGVRFSDEAEARYHTLGFIALLMLVALITVYDVRRFF